MLLRHNHCKHAPSKKNAEGPKAGEWVLPAVAPVLVHAVYELHHGGNAGVEAHLLCLGGHLQVAIRQWSNVQQGMPGCQLTQCA